jgi:hypothetical protein
LVHIDETAKIIASEDGRKIVEINTIKFSGKRKIDWKGVEQYLKQYIGKYYTIDETDDIVYIGSDFPDEYTNSKDTSKSLGTIGKAKANATQTIPELIKTLTEIKHFENCDKKHEIDAPNGWYRGTVHFTLPLTNDKGEVIGKNSFRGRMVIRCAAGNRLYLYDIVTIKKET